MNKQELYDYIVKHMTPEEALMKLLESSLVSYEKLKFESPEKSLHPIMVVAFAAFDMGWGLAIEGGDENGNMRGICLGTDEYMRDLFKNQLTDLTDEELNEVVKTHFEEWKKGNPGFPEADAQTYWSGINDGMYHLRKVLRDKRTSNEDAAKKETDIPNDGEIID